MTPQLVQALWWTVVFVAIAVTIAAGIRLVDWIMGGSATVAWKAAIVLIGAAASGGRAVVEIRNGK